MTKITTNSRTDLKEYVSHIVSDIKEKINDPSSYQKGENKPVRRRPTITREVDK